MLMLINLADKDEIKGRGILILKIITTLFIFLLKIANLSENLLISMDIPKKDKIKG